MITRYNLMKESKVRDSDNESFPDPLSLNYKEIIEQGTFIQPFLKVEIDDSFIEKPYIMVYAYYSSENGVSCIDGAGQIYLDDIILDLNNVKHKDSLLGDETLLFPSSSELSAFISAYSRE
jgi:hypothetical protein